MRRVVAVACLAVAITIAIPARSDAATVVRTWSVGIEPFGVTVDPRDGRVYVANSDHNRSNMPVGMSVVDPASGATSFTLPGPQVMSVLDTSLDRLFVTMSNGLGVVDVPTRTLVTTVPTSPGAGLALDPTTHRVYVATINGLSMVDGQTGVVLATRAAANPNDAWWHVAHDPIRHRLFVSNGNFAGSPSVVVLDDADLSAVGTVALPAVPRLALAADSARGLVYVGGFSGGSAPAGSVYAIDETSLQVVSTLDVGAGVASPFSLTLASGTNTLFVSDVASFGGNALVAVDTSTFTVRERTPLSFQPGQSALHPDGRLYVSGFNTQQLVALRIVNAPPVVDSVSLSPTAPRTNDVLTATAAGSDPDGDALTYTFTWKVNGSVRRATTTPGTTDSFDLSVAGNGDKGDVVSVSVVASDGIDTSAPATRSVVVANTGPTLAVSLSDTAPRKRDVLVVTAAAADADADALTYSYTWRVNGKVKRTTTGTTASTSSLDLRAVEAENGDVVTVDVVVTDGTATASASASATVTPPGH